MSAGTPLPAGGSGDHRAGRVVRFYGKYPAIVVDNEPDGDAAHRGEVLVAVPAILEDAPADGPQDGGDLPLETGAVDNRRPIRVRAKPCFAPGSFFLPEPGHHVWVEFAAGDVNEPIWSGLWLAQGETPETSDDAPPTAGQRVIRTTSGHVIEFDDRDGDQRLVIREQSGTTVVLDPTGVRVDTDGEVEVRAANVTVECDRLTVHGELRVSNGATSTTIRGNEIRGSETEEA